MPGGAVRQAKAASERGVPKLPPTNVGMPADSRNWTMKSRANRGDSARMIILSRMKGAPSVLDLLPKSSVYRLGTETELAARD